MILLHVTREFENEEIRKPVIFVCISGISGEVAINEDGNRIPVFVFSNRQNGHLIAIVEIDQTKTPIDSVTTYNVTTVWPNGTTTVPRDTPKCGFQGEKCLNTPGGECIRLKSSSFEFKMEFCFRVRVRIKN